MNRTWCCNTPITGPHISGCMFSPDAPIDYLDPAVVLPKGHVWLPSEMQMMAARAAISRYITDIALSHLNPTAKVLDTIIQAAVIAIREVRE